MPVPLDVLTQCDPPLPELRQDFCCESGKYGSFTSCLLVRPPDASHEGLVLLLLATEALYDLS